MTERTLSIVKPDAVAKHAIGDILRRFEAAGLRVVAGRLHATVAAMTAARFYVVHKERPFYGSLIEFMSSGPVFVSVLEGENAIAKYREIMGATDSTKAPKGTIRRRLRDRCREERHAMAQTPPTPRAGRSASSSASSRSATAELTTAARTARRRALAPRWRLRWR